MRLCRLTFHPHRLGSLPDVEQVASLCRDIDEKVSQRLSLADLKQ